MGIVVMLAIWVVLGVLIAALTPNIFKGERPYGERADYIAAVIATIVTGLGDWYILPLINIEGALRFVAALIEPILAALVVLWVMRYWKRRQA
jgi:uncharacterized membrane protein YeaQ/YmgE (transglycosylase-associated protein family)